jgi:hypothetical protein
LPIQLVYYAFDDSRTVVFAQLLADPFPPRRTLWQWQAAKPGFLTALTGLTSW